MHEALELLSEYHLVVHKRVIVQQSVDHDPFRMMIKGGRSESKTVIEDFISIKDKDGNYTKEFVTLLADYYLHL